MQSCSLQARSIDLEASACAAMAEAAQLREEGDNAMAEAASVRQRLQQALDSLAEADSCSMSIAKRLGQEAAALRADLSAATEQREADQATIDGYCQELSALQVLPYFVHKSVL